MSRWARSRTKRALDVVLVIVALPVIVPVALAAGVFSLMWFRAWPVFRQERIGFHGERFRVFKIRSLPTDFPTSVGKHVLDHDGLDRMSVFLRNSHLDELPQVFNVLGGAMSLVGPRPMIPEVVELLEPEDQISRHLVRPGLTGMWQLSTMGGRSLHECPGLDRAYVQHADVRLDVMLLWWSLRAITRVGLTMTPDELLARIRS